MDTQNIKPKTVQQTLLDKIQESPEGALPKDLVDSVGKQASYIHSCVSRMRSQGHNIVLRNGRYVCDETRPTKKAPPARKSIDKGETSCQKSRSPMKITRSLLFGYDQDRIDQFLDSLTVAQREDIELIVIKATHACDVVNNYATFIKLRNDLKI